MFLLEGIDNFTPEEYQQYRKSLENMGDYHNIINTAAEEAEKRGLAQGLSQGREEGEIEGKAEGIMNVARQMKQMGLPDSTIAEATGLSLEDIESL